MTNNTSVNNFLYTYFIYFLVLVRLLEVGFASWKMNACVTLLHTVKFSLVGVFHFSLQQAIFESVTFSHKCLNHRLCCETFGFLPICSVRNSISVTLNLHFSYEQDWECLYLKSICISFSVKYPFIFLAVFLSRCLFYSFLDTLYV